MLTPSCQAETRMPMEGFAEKAVHLWKCNVEENAVSAHEMFRLLSLDERQRAERYRVENARRQFVIARGALRQILGGYLDLSPEALDFGYLEHGKPRLRNENVDGISFNLSHSENICLIAI